MDHVLDTLWFNVCNMHNTNFYYGTHKDKIFFVNIFSEEIYVTFREKKKEVERTNKSMPLLLYMCGGRGLTAADNDSVIVVGGLLAVIGVYIPAPKYYLFIYIQK